MKTFKSSSPTTNSPNTKAFGSATTVQTGVYASKTPIPSMTSLPILQQTNVQSSCYSLEPAEVKRVLNAKFNDQPYDKKQFLYYHLNRNYFNMKDVVTALTITGPRFYKDNLGRVWFELLQVQNIYHMPSDDRARSSLPFTTPYSRKFVSTDDISGVGGEFEMIVRQDGKRIDAHTNTAYQETYNYGRTNLEPRRHIALDVKPHDDKTIYVSYGAMGYVKIIELGDVVKSSIKKLGDLID